MPTVKLTKTVVDSIKKPDSGQTFYRDKILPGFALRVGRNSKAYIVEKRVKGKLSRITIGKHGQITTEQARIEAQRILGLIVTGKNPNKEENEVIQVTLIEVFREYLETRKALKLRTISDYNIIMNSYFSDWHDIYLLNITRDMVVKRHSKLGKRSHAQANYAMRVLRALFNFAKGQYEDDNGDSLFLKNPVDRLSQTRAWYEVQRRRTVISSDQLKPFIEATNQLSNTIVRDFLLFLLFTGLRKGEGTALKWGEVNFNTKSFCIQDTKNKEPLRLPMSDYIYELLDNRHKERVHEYVFPGKGKDGHLVEPRKQMAKVTEVSGVSFTLHDFRRTFITIAESLDISSYAVKHLVNHKMKGDVTAGYIIMDVERLRKPMQKITDYILEKAEIKANS